MSAVLIQFPGEYKPHVQPIPITVSAPETVPLRSVSCDPRNDSYVLTIPERVALEAFCLASMVTLVMFACFWVL